MSTELEIEFKNLLSKEEFMKIKQIYFKNQKPFKQTNFYIDTPNSDIVTNKMALRIREKENKYEMTLKVPQEIGLLEHSAFLESLPEKNAYMAEEMIPKNILNELKNKQIPTKQLQLLGDLTTYRMERQLDSGLLVLDHSFYFNNEDYEVEFETQNYEQGKKDFKLLLDELNIIRQEPRNKIKRFFDAKKDKV